MSQLFLAWLATYTRRVGPGSIQLVENQKSLKRGDEPILVLAEELAKHLKRMTKIKQFQGQKVLLESYRQYYQSLIKVLPESYQSIIRVLPEPYQSLIRVLSEYYQSLIRVLPD